jgi:alpha-beta hydrolase superfamily lysophospholipase
MTPARHATATRRAADNAAAAPPPGATIVFSHANGFGASTYRVLFDAWRKAGWQVHALDKFGHDPKYPVTSNWPHLRDQLTDFVRREVGGPVVFVGHSLGGYLSLLVPRAGARRRAARFAAGRRLARTQPAHGQA